MMASTEQIINRNQVYTKLYIHTYTLRKERLLVALNEIHRAKLG